MRSRAHLPVQLLALLLVALWGARPVLELAHTRVHAHRFCAAHRAFEDIPAGEDLGRLTWPGTDQAFERASPLLAATAHPTECGFASTQGRRAELPGPVLQPLVAPVLDVSRPAPAPPRPRSSLSILDTAPKASPPAFG